ncbi:MAG TPA: hypothetical protein VFK70_02055, partial [Vicinamibacteria bacterium]|nr:hypothetical protein [Vicinamibacteria bacterium]
AISEATVKAHLTQVFRKLDLCGRTRLAIRYQESEADGAARPGRPLLVTPHDDAIDPPRTPRAEEASRDRRARGERVQRALDDVPGRPNLAAVHDADGLQQLARARVAPEDPAHAGAQGLDSRSLAAVPADEHDVRALGGAAQGLAAVADLGLAGFQQHDRALGGRARFVAAQENDVGL